MPIPPPKLVPLFWLPLAVAVDQDRYLIMRRIVIVIGSIITGMEIAEH